MSNLQLDTGSNIDSSSIGSVCHLFEAYENLWVCLEDKKGIYFFIGNTCICRRDFLCEFSMRGKGNFLIF